MSYEEMRKTILFKYHKDINYWRRLLGEMFEGTDGWESSGGFVWDFEI